LSKFHPTKNKLLKFGDDLIFGDIFLGGENPINKNKLG
jgi:hypothetical protein